MLCNKAIHKVPYLVCLGGGVWGGSDERGSLLALVPLLEGDTHQRGEGRGRGWEGQGHKRRGREGGEARNGHWEGRHMCRLGEME